MITGGGNNGKVALSSSEFVVLSLVVDRKILSYKIY